MEDGAYTFEHYGEDSGAYVEYDWDGPVGASQGYKYDFVKTVTDPLYNKLESVDPTNYGILKLQDGTKISMSADEQYMYVFNYENYSPNFGYRNGPEYEDFFQVKGTCYVFEKSGVAGEIGNAIGGYRNSRLFLTSPSLRDTDGDGILDGDEYLGNQNFDSDKLPNYRDPDSDNDGALDGQEEYGIDIEYDGTSYSFTLGFDEDLSLDIIEDKLEEKLGGIIDTSRIEYNKGILEEDLDPSIIDLDSDDDGLMDGDELLPDINTDPMDPDSDNDGIVDGYIHGKIWNPISKKFQIYFEENNLLDFESIFTNSATGYGYAASKFPSEVPALYGEADMSQATINNENIIEFNDGNAHFKSKPNKPDSDGDGLWDGIDVYEYNSGVLSRTQLGEYYYSGLPFSGGQENDIYQPLSFSNKRTFEVSTEPLMKDTDYDGLIDKEEMDLYSSVFVEKLGIYEGGEVITELIESPEVYTNPTDADTDRDGFADGFDIQTDDPVARSNLETFGVQTINLGASTYFLGERTKHNDWGPTSANLDDTDGDGKKDYEEVYIFGTSPVDQDTDNDLLPDYTHNYDGLKDGDGKDVISVNLHTTNLLNYPFMFTKCELGEDAFGTSVDSTDTDADGHSDRAEVYYLIENSLSAGRTSYDITITGDLLTNVVDDLNSLTYPDVNDLTDPKMVDVDNDGYWNMLDDDSDNDGLKDGEEEFWFAYEYYQYDITPSKFLDYSYTKGNIFEEDTDSDGLIDVAEGIVSYIPFGFNRGQTVDIDEDFIPALFDTYSDNSGNNDFTNTIVSFRTNAEWNSKMTELEYSLGDKIQVPDISTNSNSINGQYILKEYTCTNLDADVSAITRTNLQTTYTVGAETIGLNIYTPDGNLVTYNGADSNYPIYILQADGTYAEFTNPATGGSKNSIESYAIKLLESYDRRLITGKDSDGDNLPDTIENALAILINDNDFDDDGLLNYLDDDSDNDGYFDGSEIELLDIDGDSILGMFETDGDNDNIEDKLEDSGGKIRMVWEPELGETNPRIWDTDRDGIRDGYENVYYLTDDPSIVYETDPLDFDSDDDGLPDGFELGLKLVFEWGNDKTMDLSLYNTYSILEYDLDPESESYGINLFVEDWRIEQGGVWENPAVGELPNLDPMSADTDRDYLTDCFEIGLTKDDLFFENDIEFLGEGIKLTIPRSKHVQNLPDGHNGPRIITNPIDPDTDGDNIPDGWKDGYIWGATEGYFIDISSINTPSHFVDNEGMCEKWEGEYPYDAYREDIPLAAQLARINPDTDFDGLSDDAEVFGWEYDATLTPEGRPSGYIPIRFDVDAYYTDPYNIDTDGDGLVDGWSKPLELSYNTIYDQSEIELSSSTDLGSNLLERFNIWDIISGPSYGLDTDTRNGVDDRFELLPNNDGEGYTLSRMTGFFKFDIGVGSENYVYYVQDLPGDTKARFILGEMDVDKCMILKELFDDTTTTEPTHPQKPDSDNDGLADGVEVGGWQKFLPNWATSDGKMMEWEFSTNEETFRLNDEDRIVIIPSRLAKDDKNLDDGNYRTSYIQTHPNIATTNAWFTQNINPSPRWENELYSMMDGELLFDLSPQNGLTPTLTINEDGEVENAHDLIAPAINILKDDGDRIDVENGIIKDLDSHDGSKGFIEKEGSSLTYAKVNLNLRESLSYIQKFHIKMKIVERDLFVDNTYTEDITFEFGDSHFEADGLFENKEGGYFIDLSKCEIVGGRIKKLEFNEKFNLKSIFKDTDKFNSPEIASLVLTISAVDAYENEGEVKIEGAVDPNFIDILKYTPLILIPVIGPTLFWTGIALWAKDKWVDGNGISAEEARDSYQQITKLLNSYDGGIFTALKSIIVGMADGAITTSVSSLALFTSLMIDVKTDDEETPQDEQQSALLTFIEKLLESLKLEYIMNIVQVIHKIVEFVKLFAGIMTLLKEWFDIDPIEQLFSIATDSFEQFTGGATTIGNAITQITDDINTKKDEFIKSKDVRKVAFKVVYAAVNRILIQNTVNSILENTVFNREYNGVLNRLREFDILTWKMKLKENVFMDLNDIRQPAMDETGINEIRTPTYIGVYNQYDAQDVYHFSEEVSSFIADFFDLIKEVLEKIPGLGVDVFKYVFAMITAIIGTIMIMTDVAGIETKQGYRLPGKILASGLFGVSFSSAMDGLVDTVFTKPVAWPVLLIGGGMTVGTLMVRIAATRNQMKDYRDSNYNGLVDIEERTGMIYNIDVYPYDERDYYIKMHNNGELLSGDRLGDYDGDGILDAEELMPLFVNVANGDDIQNNPPLTSLRPGPYEMTDPADLSSIWKYGDFWKEKNGIDWQFHDIDANVKTESYFKLDNGNYLVLDPTNPDTDGDGIWDGDEITDDDGYWPDDIEGRFKSEQSTNPLDPNDPPRLN